MKCSTCRYYTCEEYDPSPEGVSLSSGTMADCYCEREDELEEGWGEVMCPLFSPFIMLKCKRHNISYWENDTIGCDRCHAELDEYERKLDEDEAKSFQW